MNSSFCRVTQVSGSPAAINTFVSVIRSRLSSLAIAARVRIAYQIILAVVGKHILCKQRFAVVGGYTGLKAMVSGFDIAVTVVDTDNLKIV